MRISVVLLPRGRTEDIMRDRVCLSYLSAIRGGHSIVQAVSWSKPAFLGGVRQTFLSILLTPLQEFCKRYVRESARRTR